MDNNTNNDNIQRYQASSTNLNTIISNPSVNINDTMNMNIQNMTSNNNTQSTIVNTNVTAPNIPVNTREEPTNKYINTNINQNITPNPSISTSQNITPNNNMTTISPNINRTYVTNEVKPQKKTPSIKMGSEFKTALLIVVILLIFILFLPMISDLIH